MAVRYGAFDPIHWSNGVKIDADVICLTQTCAEGWTISYKKTPASVRHFTSNHACAILFICFYIDFKGRN